MMCVFGGGGEVEEEGVNRICRTSEQVEGTVETRSRTTCRRNTLFINNYQL